MTTDNLFLGGSVAFLLVVLFILFLYNPRKLKQSYFVERWKKIQSYCRDKKTWPKALEEADKLLRLALKKKRVKGKSMGEKMVSAQRLFTDNDSLWYAHNLYKKVTSNPATKKKLKESDVKDALIGFRQALRDLEALPHDGHKA